MSIALLIVDMQKEFRNLPDTKEVTDKALEYINEVSQLFRAAGEPVVFVQDTSVDKGPGSEGYKLMEELHIGESDLFITKEYCNSFWQTDLEEMLKSRDVDFVVITGFAAEYCVLFTYNGAEERGFGASLLQHGVTGRDKERVKDTFNLRSTISYEAVKYMLKSRNR